MGTLLSSRVFDNDSGGWRMAHMCTSSFLHSTVIPTNFFILSGKSDFAGYIITYIR